MESYAVSAVRLTRDTMKMILGQRPVASGIRTETSEPPSISDQSPSNSSLAKAAAGKRLSIALTAAGVDVSGSAMSCTRPGAPGAWPTSSATWQSTGRSRTALIKVSAPAL